MTAITNKKLRDKMMKEKTLVLKKDRTNQTKHIRKEEQEKYNTGEEQEKYNTGVIQFR